jgi:hypothetical protein
VRDDLRRLAWGLDLASPDVTTQAEIDEFRRVASQRWRVPQPGLDYWLDERPDVLKRYRAWADTLHIHAPDKAPDSYNATGAFSIFINYAQYGFRDGLRYTLLTMNQSLTRAQLVDLFALAFRYVGPRGMAHIAEAVREHEWHEPARPARWPDGWQPDPEAFKSGIDFSTPTLSDEERNLIEAWYLRYLGEVPGHILLLANQRPEMLKAYRNRFENTLRVLPKQVEPIVLIENSIERALPQGVREGVLMARGFGVAKSDVLEAISWGSFYGTMPGLDIAYEVVVDVLDTWPDPA